MDNHSNNEITKKTIMICDDESDVLISFELLLQLKYDIIMVASGEKCVEKYIEEINRGNISYFWIINYMA